MRKKHPTQWFVIGDSAQGGVCGFGLICNSPKLCIMRPCHEGKEQPVLQAKPVGVKNDTWCTSAAQQCGGNLQNTHAQLTKITVSFPDVMKTRRIAVLRAGNEITPLQLEKCTQEQVVWLWGIFYSCSLGAVSKLGQVTVVFTDTKAYRFFHLETAFASHDGEKKREQGPKEPTFGGVRVACGLNSNRTHYEDKHSFVFFFNDLKSLVPLWFIHPKPFPTIQRTERFNLCQLFEEQIWAELIQQSWRLGRFFVCLFKGISENSRT